nr:hypothetical protein CFP56_47594 [Quercus suber]
MVVEVGEGSSHSRESVQEELEAALAAEQARADASDDDETQPPEDLVQETLVSNNGHKKRGKSLMQRTWSLPKNMKIECGLNGRGQPIGESRKHSKGCWTLFASIVTCASCLDECPDSPQSRLLDRD